MRPTDCDRIRLLRRVGECNLDLIILISNLANFLPFGSDHSSMEPVFDVNLFGNFILHGSYHFLKHFLRLEDAFLGAFNTDFVAAIGIFLGNLNVDQRLLLDATDVSTTLPDDMSVKFRVAVDFHGGEIAGSLFVKRLEAFSRAPHLFRWPFDDDFVLANAEIDLDLGQIRGNGPNVSTFLADDESVHPGWDVDLLNNDRVGLFVDEREGGAEGELLPAKRDRLRGRFQKRHFHRHAGLVQDLVEIVRLLSNNVFVLRFANFDGNHLTFGFLFFINSIEHLHGRHDALLVTGDGDFISIDGRWRDVDANVVLFHQLVLDAIPRTAKEWMVNLLDVQPLKGEFRLLVGNELNLVFRLFDVFFRARNLDFVTVHIRSRKLNFSAGFILQIRKIFAAFPEDEAVMFLRNGQADVALRLQLRGDLLPCL